MTVPGAATWTELDTPDAVFVGAGAAFPLTAFDRVAMDVLGAGTAGIHAVLLAPRGDDWPEIDRPGMDDPEELASRRLGPPGRRTNCVS